MKRTEISISPNTKEIINQTVIACKQLPLIEQLQFAEFASVVHKVLTFHNRTFSPMIVFDNVTLWQLFTHSDKITIPTWQVSQLRAYQQSFLV